MNYFDLYLSYPDRTIAAAWDSQIKEADNTPWLGGTLTECGDELFARFAACYAELRALPRSARRALQRRLAHSTELAAILPQYLQQGGRRLQHRMAWSLAGAALLLALGQGVATAATITVTTNDPRIIPDGQCSLLEAIVNANNDAATHADCPAGSGADTIVLPAKANIILSNAYVTRYSTPFGTTFSGPPLGLPSITSQITIEGNGATIARDGNAPAFGLMEVRGSFDGSGTRVNPGDLTLQEVTLTGGSSSGGLSNNGTLSIKNSIISGNTGRGVNNNFRAALTIENSAISGNTGGGINNYYGTLTIHNSTVSGNTSNFGGGGLNNSAGTVTITNSTISDNTGGVGGGVSNSFGYYYGGTGDVTITNSTISGNRANRGGGVYNVQRCFFNTFTGNSGCVFAALTLNRSLIAGNQASAGPEIENAVTRDPMSPEPVNNVTANNFNLFGTNGNAGVSGFTPGPNDIVPGVGLAQILKPLKNNGGPTQTHALVAGSPAIDAGDPGGCRDNQGAFLQTDQRGFARHADGNNDGAARCDIGAVEGAGGAATLIDFDGDGITDIGVYRNGIWFIRRSFDGGITSVGWGGLAQDKPVPGDYDGDGKVDHAVYRDGIWFILRSSDGGLTTVGWGGVAQDIPLPADYDGDGKADIAVYRGGMWFILRSSDGGLTTVGWGGVLADVPVPADYDGDAKADIAVYRNGTWFILRSSDGGLTTVGWGGLPQDIPVPADFDGDGKADVAVYRDGIWFILRSSDGAMTATGWGGTAEDIPLNRPWGKM
ncbi:MAG TPA: choice-of-anchor Q domain-containing protein [Candidatus Binatia bacterium]|nr:choice-of-anchor Q domain-containing protein [Candidatus Binatia bacterium]